MWTGKEEKTAGDLAGRVSKTLSEAEACVSDEAERGGPSTVGSGKEILLIF